MLKKLPLAFLFSALAVTAQAQQGDFSIHSIGFSKNTKTIFLETKIDIPDTTCSNKRIFRLAKDDIDADRFLSIALAAQAQSKKVTVDYDPNVCVSDGTMVRVFRIRAQ